MLIFRSKPLENFDKWRISGLYSYLAYLDQEEIEQFIGLLGKDDSEIKETLDKENYEEFKLLEPGLLEIREHKIKYIHHPEFDTDVYVFQNSRQVHVVCVMLKDSFLSFIFLIFNFS